MWSVLQLLEEGVTHLGVATDHVIESFRNDLWPGYKSSAGMSELQCPAGGRQRAGAAIGPGRLNVGPVRRSKRSTREQERDESAGNNRCMIAHDDASNLRKIRS